MRYAIIGGGIAGASVAYHLSERTDDEVVLFERQSPASETTYKSVGQFGFYGDDTQFRMKRYGMRLYNEFFADPRANPRYHSAGLLIAATSRDGAADLETAAETGDGGSHGPDGERSEGDLLEGEGAGRDLVEYVPGGEVADSLLLPPVDVAGIEGALYRPNVGYMSRPQELAYEFLERATENGVTVKQGTRVTDVTTGGGRVRGVRTADGREFDAEAVVCAAGPWNVELAESLGVDIPVEHTIAPVIRLRPQRPVEYDLPIISHYESPYSFHRRAADELLVSYNPGDAEATRFDPDAMGESVPARIRNRGIDLLAELVPGWLDAEVVEEWVGIRSQTPDGNPVVGWTELAGFSIVAFHTSGIQLAPAVGDVVAAQLVDDDPTPYYDALSISRFDGYDDCRAR